MFKYKVLALDLDDTVLDSDKKISIENKKWISKADELGVTVIFATGRGLVRVEHLREELNLHAPMVLVNGAEVWAKPGKLLERHFIDQDILHRLYDLALENETKFWGYTDEDLIRAEDYKEKMLEMNFLKLGIRHPDYGKMERIREEVRKYSSIEVTQSADTNLEVSQKGISKATGVHKVCEYLGVEMEDVMAIGDNLNDLKLIQTAGLGVAMSNGAKKLKKEADIITDTNDNHGVAKAIKNYLFEGSEVK